MDWDWAVVIDWHRAMVSENDKIIKKLIAFKLTNTTGRLLTHYGLGLHIKSVYYPPRIGSFKRRAI
jgi:hypothetical protein